MGFEESRKWQWQRPPSLLLLFIFFSAGLLFYINVYEVQRGYKVIEPTLIFETNFQTYVDATEDADSKGFLLKTKGCRIPIMEPLSAEVKRFIFDEKPVICNNGTPALVESDLTSLYLVNNSFAAYEVNDTNLLRCCYTPFWREDPSGNARDIQVKYGNDCTVFNGSVVIDVEFVLVKCTYNSSAIYKDYFSFAPLKSTIEAMSDAQNKINVLVFGLDSVSRLNFHRQMQKTASALKDVKAIELLGYNKVGDNTFPNLMPILTGLSEADLIKECWSNATTRFDNCPFIWKKFNASGYVTAFGEDASWMGIFNYQKWGFKHQPTHYFWNSYDYEAENLIGNTHRMNIDQCIGAEEGYKTLSKYAEKFVKSMRKYRKSYFGFFWSSNLSHDVLNKPKLGDEFFASFITKLKNDNLLENTFFIFLSDHGIRWGQIRSTFQGRIEERLPFIHIYLPEWYRNQHTMAYSNLVRNARRLTTPFDLHATLEDLLDPFALTKDFLDARRQNNTSSNKYFYSLFDTIPPERTCKDAEISPHWCTCEESIRVNTTNQIVLEAANFTVNYINRLLDGYAECVNLELDKVIDSHMQTHHEEIRQEHAEQDYTLTLRTKPSDAIFEATVRTKPNKSEYDYEIIGTISRINLYGKQSLCMTDFHLKLYCVCRQLL